MPTFDHIQSSFAGGEVSPRLFGRVESDLYKKALSSCLNWELTPHGSARLRPGSSFIGSLAGDARTRLVPFRLANAQDLILELTDHQLRIYSDAGISQPVTTVELLANGDFSLPDGTGWQYLNANANINGQVVFTTMAGGGGTQLGYAEVQNRTIAEPNPLLYQKVTVLAAADLSLKFDLGSAADTPTCRVRIASTDPATWATPGTALNYVSGITDVYSQSFVAPTGSTTEALGIVAHVPAGTYWLCFDITGATSVHVNIDNVFLSASSAGFPIPTPWSADQAAAVQYVADTGADRMFFAHPNAPPFFLQLGTDGAWSFGSIIFAAQPSSWAGTNYPGTIEFFQSRLYLAATPSEGNHLWASRPGSPFDFTLQDVIDSTPTVTASNAIDASLATKGVIRWLRGRQIMLVGTDLGEHSITAQGGAVTPIDMQVRQESAFGSGALQAEDLGDQVLYVSGDLRKVRALNYYFQENAWLSHDVTFVAEHITGSPVKEAHWARDPNSTVVLILQDGTMALCTYDRGAQEISWWRAQTAGTVLSAAVSNGPDGSRIFMAVQRPSGVHLEQMPMSEFASGRGFLDASVTAAIPDNLVITGLYHLDGMTVGIVLDGAIEDDQVVVGGQVTLERAGTSVTIGLGYTATGTTLPPEGGNPRGTAQRAKRRWAKVGMRLNDSALPLINGERPPDRSPMTTTDAATGRQTGDVIFSPPSDWGRGELTFVQDLPLRTEILAFYGPVSVSEV